MRSRAAGHRVSDVDIDHADMRRRTSTCTSCCPKRPRYHARAARDARGCSTRRACGFGWKWAATCWRKITCARCALRALLSAYVDAALEVAMRSCCRRLAIPAPPLGAATVDDRRRHRTVRAAMLRLTQLFNVTGHPAIALPAATARRAASGHAARRHRETDRRTAGRRTRSSAQITGGAGSVGGGTG